MHKTHKDVITWRMLLKKAPLFAQLIPRYLRGMKYGMGKAPTSVCGVAWTFRRAVQHNPQGTALLYENKRFSYRELDEWSNRLAHYLTSTGLKKGETVALLMENRPEFLVCVLAIAKTGAVSALLNTAQEHKVLRHSIELVQPNIAIIGEELMPNFEEIRTSDVWHGKTAFFFADQDTTKNLGSAPAGYCNLALAAEHYPTSPPDTEQNIFAEDPAFYLFTSGTTGLPKAGVYSHGRWMKAFAGFGLFVLNLNKKDTLYSTLPLFHATALCVCWNATIAGYATFALRRRFSAKGFWRDARKYNATVIAYVGELCRYLLEQAAQTDDQKHLVKTMIGNGLRPNLWRKFKQRFGIDKVYEIYGASDGNIGFSNLLNFDNTVGFSNGTWALVKYDKVNEAPFRDDKGFMQTVAKGEEGLLIAKIQAQSPLDGYTDPAKTKQVVYTDVFKPGDCWFNTGDMLRDIGFGHAQFVDRLGDTFRWKGENVSTTEVENIIAEHSQILEAVVYGVALPNADGKAGMAAITLAVPLTHFDGHNLCAYLKQELPQYAIPLFLRVRNSMETTDTYKYFKSNLKQEGFDLKQVGQDPVYVLLPGADEYTLLDNTQLNDIKQGLYKF